MFCQPVPEVLIDDVDLHSVTDESTVSDDDDDGDDDVARALAFAKMRAAYSGMSAAMINFSAAIQESDDEEGDGQLSVLASKVISSICQCECSSFSEVCPALINSRIFQHLLPLSAICRYPRSRPMRLTRTT